MTARPTVILACSISLVSACGLGDPAAVAAQPGRWKLTIRRVADEAATDQPQRLVTVPTLPDQTVRLEQGQVACHAGCQCTFGAILNAQEHHDGFVADETYAWVEFEEICSNGIRVVCNSLVFSANAKTAMGSCLNMSNTEAATALSKNISTPLLSYAVRLERVSYD